MSPWFLVFVPLVVALEHLAPGRPLWILLAAAIKNRMDLALSIAIGSSVQVSHFVAPCLVLSGYAVAPTPTDLAFSGGLVLTVLLSMVILGQVAGDGRSDWRKGVQLLSVYAILGLAFYFAPIPAAH